MKSTCAPFHLEDITMVCINRIIPFCLLVDSAWDNHTEIILVTITVIKKHPLAPITKARVVEPGIGFPRRYTDHGMLVIRRIPHYPTRFNKVDLPSLILARRIRYIKYRKYLCYLLGLELCLLSCIQNLKITKYINIFMFLLINIIYILSNTLQQG